jgi:hypothetical protein
VFHYDGWLAHVIDPSNQPPEFLARLSEEVSPDGAGHYQIVVDKLARMHAREPTLVPDDLGDLRSRTLVMVGDDDERSGPHHGADPPRERPSCGGDTTRVIRVP